MRLKGQLPQQPVLWHYYYHHDEQHNEHFDDDSHHLHFDKHNLDYDDAWVPTEWCNLPRHY
jgi:hypothetical protein